MKKLVYLVAGGTGGHINAAISVGEVLKNTYVVQYVTGTRYLDYKLFPNKDVLHLKSKPIRTKNPLIFLRNVLLNLWVFIFFMGKLIRKRPAFIVGAGGYVCGPTLLAAYLLLIPVFIIEQNAVMGVTNKLLSKIAKKIFVHFKHTKGLIKSHKVIVSGNPIRANISYNEQTIGNDINLLIFGGSLGAQQINEAVELMIQEHFLKRLNIIHQVGLNNITRSRFTNEFINYMQVEYIEDIEQQYKWANIIISRAGASSVSELMTVGKPVLLIPYPQATDNHQFFNAFNLKQEAKFFVSIINSDLQGKELTSEIVRDLNFLISNVEKLKSYQEFKKDYASKIIKHEIEKCLE